MVFVFQELEVLFDTVHLELHQTVVSQRGARSGSCYCLGGIPNCLIVQLLLPTLELVVRVVRELLMTKVQTVEGHFDSGWMPYRFSP